MLLSECKSPELLRKRFQLKGKIKPFEEFLEDNKTQLKYSSLAKMESQYFSYCLRFSDEKGWGVCLLTGLYGRINIKDLVYTHNPFLDLIPKEDCFMGAYMPIPRIIGSIPDES